MTDATINTVYVHPRFPIVIGTTPIAALVAKPQTPTSHAAAVQAAKEAEGLPFKTAFRRAWVLSHVEALDAAGRPVPYGLADMLAMPWPYAFALQDLHHAADVPAGSA